MNIITVTYKDDWANMLYLARSLAKNWLGPKEWVIIPEDGARTRDFILERIVPMMGLEWRITIPEPPRIKATHGWWRQQIYKLWYGSINSHEYSLVLDSKNFLITPIDSSWFFQDDRLRVRVFHRDRPVSAEWAQACCYFGSLSNKSQPWTLSPWVWRTDLVKLTVEEYLLRKCDIYNSTTLPAWEYLAYWYWAHDRQPWVDTDFGGGIHSALDTWSIDKHRQGPFWMFHRRMKENTNLIDVNNQFLKDCGIIDDVIIKEWNQLLYE